MKMVLIGISKILSYPIRGGGETTSFTDTAGHYKAEKCLYLGVGSKKGGRNYLQNKVTNLYSMRNRADSPLGPM